MLIVVELKRLYFSYGKEEREILTDQDKWKLGGKPKIILKVKEENECDPNCYNILDQELIYLAKIEGSKQSHINLTLKRDLEARLIHLTVEIEG